jgi:alkylation response protein AidB-like acyl-CoA dehydrogenase
MDLRLSDKQRDLKRRARRFFDEVLEPLELLVDEQGHLPQDKRPAVKEAVLAHGMNAINHIKDYGGQGLGLLEQSLVNEELGRATCGLWAVAWQPANCLAQGSEAQIDRYLAPSCRGERRACYAVSEPGAGSDPRMIRTTAERVTGGYRLSGEKWFVTSYDAADYMIVQAHVDGDSDKPTLFLVDKDAVGITHLRSPRFMHSFVFDHAELLLEGVEVGDEAVLGDVGAGYELTKDWFVEARLQIAGHCLGAAKRAAETATAYALDREQFGQRIADFQAIELKLADMAVEIMALQTLLYRVAQEVDDGLDRKLLHARASALKLRASETAGRVIDEALQVLGGRGYMRENPVERLYRDIRVDRIWEGTSEIQRLIIAGQIKKRGLAIYSEWEA